MANEKITRAALRELHLLDDCMLDQVLSPSLRSRRVTLGMIPLSTREAWRYGLSSPSLRAFRDHVRDLREMAAA